MDSALKQRLLGAAVLIALAIIFVPMFLGNAPPKQETTTRNLDIPPPPERKFETRNLPVDATAKPAADSQAGTNATPPGDKVVSVDTQAPTTFEAPESVAEAAQKPVTAAPVQPVDSKPAAVTTDKASIVVPQAHAGEESVGKFEVNLGIYADQAHANALIAKLKKLGFAAYSETTEYQGKSAQRVRVGPFNQRAAAESARLKIKQAEPKVPSSISASSEQPKTDAPPTAIAPNKAGGWAVQLGAFKSEAEANKLRDRVRNSSMAAFVDRSGSGEQMLWRVRAGPFADRGGADAARNTIKQKLQTDGIIVTQP